MLIQIISVLLWPKIQHVADVHGAVFWRIWRQSYIPCLPCVLTWFSIPFVSESWIAFHPCPDTSPPFLALRSRSNASHPFYPLSHFQRSSQVTLLLCAFWEYSWSPLPHGVRSQGFQGSQVHNICKFHPRSDSSVFLQVVVSILLYIKRIIAILCSGSVR